jgi:MFS family permease
VSTEPAALSGALPRAGLRRVLVVLCLTEITSWGILFYGFPVLAPAISSDTRWSVPTITAAFSAALVLSALAGVPVGRLLDRYGPRPVMTAGSLLAVPAVLLVAAARSLPVFVAAWLLVGLAMSATLYQPAFAALTRWYGPRRVRALTTVTLAAGLASTVFAPLTAALGDHLGWRRAYLILAVILAVVTVPGHAAGLRLTWPPADPPPRHLGAVDGLARSRGFVLLAAALSLGGFAMYAVVVNLVPLLTGRGMSTSLAATALGLGGAGQVLGRIGYPRLVATTTVGVRTAIVLLAGGATITLLGLLPGPAALLVLATVLAGCARGIFTLLQATAVTDRWGASHYGRLSGLLSAPVTLSTALAPWAGAALAHILGGYPALFTALALTSVAAAALAALSSRALP